jgi:hypothetical protein
LKKRNKEDLKGSRREKYQKRGCRKTSRSELCRGGILILQQSVQLMIQVRAPFKLTTSFRFNQERLEGLRGKKSHQDHQLLDC